MRDVNKNPILTTKVEIDKMSIQFSENRAEVDKKIYTSLTLEKARIVFFSDSWIIKTTMKDLNYVFIEFVIHNFNKNIVISQLKKGDFIKGGSASKKRIARVEDINIEKGKLVLNWFNKDSYTYRTFTISRTIFSSDKYKIIMTEAVKGKEAMTGMQAGFIKNQYTRNRILEFQKSMINFELDHLQNSDKKILKLERQLIRINKLKSIRTSQ